MPARSQLRKMISLIKACLECLPELNLHNRPWIKTYLDTRAYTSTILYSHLYSNISKIILVPEPSACARARVNEYSLRVWFQPRKWKHLYVAVGPALYQAHGKHLRYASINDIIYCAWGRADIPADNLSKKSTHQLNK